MLDNLLVGFSTRAITSYKIATGMTTVTNNSVTVGSKSTVTATDATGTDWLVMPDLDQLSAVAPEEGLALGIFFTAGTGAGGGTTGTALFTPTLVFGDNGSAVKSTRIGAPITLVVTAGVLVPQYAQLPVGWISNHKYWKLSWVIALTTITSIALTDFTVAWELVPDSARAGVTLIS